MKPHELRKALVDLNIDYRDFAKHIGVTDRGVRKWLAGTAPIPRATEYLIRMMQGRPANRRLFYEMVSKYDVQHSDKPAQHTSTA